MSPSGGPPRIAAALDPSPEGDAIAAEERDYYATHGRMSDPREQARLLDALPRDPTRLVAAVSGLILHRAFVAPLGITPHPGSADDVECRAMAKILERIAARDPAPLDAARPPERRFIGICRDYALLACAALRHHGIPARVRVGFATYFTPDFHEDHVVCEYHANGRWRLLDPELSERVRRHFRIAFDPADVPRDAFLVAGDAWLRVRRGALASERCGVSSAGHAGAWFIAANVLRDLAALNKREMLQWDGWGLARDFRPGVALSESAAAHVDALAALTSPPALDWRALRERYERDEWVRVPPVIRSFTTAGPREVAVDV